MSAPVKIPYAVEFDEGRHVAYCDFFHSSTDGKTREEATANLVEAVECHIETLMEYGDFEKTMKAGGHDVTADDVLDKRVALCLYETEACNATASGTPEGAVARASAGMQSLRLSPELLSSAQCRKNSAPSAAMN